MYTVEVLRLSEGFAHAAGPPSVFGEREVQRKECSACRTMKPQTEFSDRQWRLVIRSVLGDW